VPHRTVASHTALTCFTRFSSILPLSGWLHELRLEDAATTFHAISAWCHGTSAGSGPGPSLTCAGPPFGAVHEIRPVLCCTPVRPRGPARSAPDRQGCEDVVLSYGSVATKNMAARAMHRIAMVMYEAVKLIRAACSTYRTKPRTCGFNQTRLKW
jgi:hypothetical protein